MIGEFSSCPRKTVVLQQKILFVGFSEEQKSHSPPSSVSAHEPGRISDQASDLLDNLINRLHPSDRPRLRTYCYQLIAATTTLGRPWDFPNSNFRQLQAEVLLLVFARRGVA